MGGGGRAYSCSSSSSWWRGSLCCRCCWGGGFRATGAWFMDARAFAAGSGCCCTEARRMVAIGAADTLLVDGSRADLDAGSRGGGASSYNDAWLLGAVRALRRDIFDLSSVNEFCGYQRHVSHRDMPHVKSHVPPSHPARRHTTIATSSRSASYTRCSLAVAVAWPTPGDARADLAAYHRSCPRSCRCTADTRSSSCGDTDPSIVWRLYWWRLR
jgi:hypothetical protein